MATLFQNNFSLFYINVHLQINFISVLHLNLMFDQHDNFRMEARVVAKVLDIAIVNKDNFLPRYLKMFV